MAHRTDTLENMVAQMWIAFGQGIGEIGVAASAVDAVAESYGGLAQSVFDKWSSHGIAALDFIRDLGRLCAGRAREDGAEWIDETHVRDSIEVVVQRHGVVCPSVPVDQPLA